MNEYNVNVKKINKFELYKIETFCSINTPNKEVKRQSTKWEKIFTKYISDKDFACRILKEPFKIQQLKKFPNNPIKKRAKYMNKYFIEEGIWMVNKHVKTHSASLAVSRVQSKTTMRYHHNLPK